jgi:hypothetical protein
MQILRVSSLLLALAAALTPSKAQVRQGPSVAAGLAWGRQSDRAYSTTSWRGFHVALALPVLRTMHGAAVVDVTRDVFWNGNGDDCVIRPPDSTCLRDPPSVTALTIGWTHSHGRSRSLFVGVGRMSGRGRVAGGGMARYQLAMGSPLGIQVFGQYTLTPSFQHVTYQTVLAGVNLYLH